MMWRILIIIVLLSSCGGGDETPIEHIASHSIEPDLETQNQHNVYQPLIWLHPTDKASSIILASNRQNGFEFLNLQGQRLNRAAIGAIQAADLHYHFPLNGAAITLVAAVLRNKPTQFILFHWQPQSLTLTEVTAGRIDNEQPIEHLCFYHYRNDYGVFSVTQGGLLQQWRLAQTGSGQIQAQQVQQLELDKPIGHCVVDQQLGYLYLSTQGGILKYQADLKDDQLLARLAVPESTTQIAGLSLYYAGEQKGYLLASELNQNRFWVYERFNNELIADFAINAHNQIDAVEHTEAFAVTNISLNATFPQGLLIVQDNYNPGFAANYKFIAWERLAQELNLVTDSSFDPSQLGFSKPQVQTVQATVETAPVAASGDAADDLAIWVHPQDPALSTVIGTQKKGGLVVYDLQGQQLQYLADGRLNNVDLRDQFPLGSETITLVAASNRSNNQIALYQVDPVTRHLVALATRPITVGLKREAYGLCLYHDLKNHHYYVFVNDKTGSVEQWQLFANDQNQVEGRLVRQFSVGSQTEGCVVDDVQAYLFIGEENVAIWRYSADPQADETRIAVDTTRGGHLTADIEGLTLYQGEQHHGYLLASSQGNNQFNLYNRTQPHHYLGSFRIGANAQIDGVTDTDGIEAVSVPLGRHFPSGLFAVQDGRNPPENQNFKLIPWEAIADQFHLLKK